jgi:hypothetical protein
MQEPINRDGLDRGACGRPEAVGREEGASFAVNALDSDFTFGLPWAHPFRPCTDASQASRVKL